MEYVLFDLDGTLTDSGPGIMKSVRKALIAVGVSDGDIKDLGRFIGPPLEYSFKTFFGLDDKRVTEAVTAYREYYKVDIYDNSVYAGIPELLEGLKSAGKRLIVATSKPHEKAELVLKHFGLIKYFDFLSGSHPDKSLGEKAEIIRYVLDNVEGIRADDCVMVGDRKYDVAGAMECGVATVGVLHGYGTRSELEEAGAIAVAENAYELLPLLLSLKDFSLRLG